MIVADSSVLVPALLASHEFHDACAEAADLIDAATSAPTGLPAVRRTTR